MNPIPTGRLIRTPNGRDLVLTRTFRATIDDYHPPQKAYYERLAQEVDASPTS